MDTLIELYPYILKDIRKISINIEEIQKQDWQSLPYHEMSKVKRSCSDVVVERTKANEQQLGFNIAPNFLERKLEGMLDDQFLNMKMEVKLGQLIKKFP